MEFQVKPVIRYSIMTLGFFVATVLGAMVHTTTNVNGWIPAALIGAITALLYGLARSRNDDKHPILLAYLRDYRPEGIEQHEKCFARVEVATGKSGTPRLFAPRNPEARVLEIFACDDRDLHWYPVVHWASPDVTGNITVLGEHYYRGKGSLKIAMDHMARA